MDYGQLLKRAWTIVKGRPYLWWLGFLAMATEGGLAPGAGGPSGGGDFGFPFGEPSVSPDPTISPTPTVTPLQAEPSSTTDSVISRVLGEETEAFSFPAWDRLFDFMSQYWPYFLLASLVFLVLYLILLYFSYSANAGLILSVNTLEEKNENLGLGKAFQKGRKFAWRLFGFDILLFLVILFLVFILALIAIPFFMLIFDVATVDPGLVIGLPFLFLALLLIFLVVLYFGIVRVFAMRSMVLENLPVFSAFSATHTLIRRQLWHVVLTWLVAFGVSFAVGLVLVFIAFAVFGVLALIGFTIYLAASWPGVVIYALIFGFAFIASFVFLGSVYTAFNSTYFTLAYLALTYLHQKHHKTSK